VGGIVTHISRERGSFRISTDPLSVDVDAVHAYLSRSYWAAGIPREVVARSIPLSLCFSLFDAERQIGFARAVTDRATFAYLCDVYVLEEFQRRGLGTWLMEVVVSHPDLQGLRRFLLATKDAHGLYQKFGFTPIARPEIFMDISRPNFYLTQASNEGS
jgi:GNAT superfamily N-acetyltransferase